MRIERDFQSRIHYLLKSRIAQELQAGIHGFRARYKDIFNLIAVTLRYRLTFRPGKIDRFETSLNPNSVLMADGSNGREIIRRRSKSAATESEE